MILGEKFTMILKAVFVFLTVCFICMIDSGCCLTCNSICTDNNPDCINGVGPYPCPANATNCVSHKYDDGPSMGCMSNDDVKVWCTKPQKYQCKVCQQDYCNDPVS